MIKLGSLLQEKRREKSLSITQVSDAIKIPQRLLEALEAGDYEAFASEVYLKGFLRNYAQFLDIDVNKATAIYRRERKAEKEETIESKQNLETAKAIITPGRLIFGISVIIVIAVISFIGIQVNSIMQPPELSLSEPVEAMAPSDQYTEVETDTIALAGKVEVGSTLLINGNEVTTNNLQEFRVDNYKLKPGTNDIHIIAQSYYFSKTSEIHLTVNAKVPDLTADNATSEDGEETADGEEGIEDSATESMEVKVTIGEEEAWVVLKIDDETKITDVMNPGEEQSFTAEKTVSIYSPRPQMVTLTIDDKEYTFSSQTETIFKKINGDVIRE